MDIKVKRGESVTLTITRLDVEAAVLWLLLVTVFGVAGMWVLLRLMP